MKTMKNFLSMAALALMGAMMTGCSSEDDSIISNPQQPENKSKVVTLTTTVGLDGGATTRALTAGGVKTFAENDQMAVVYKKKTGGATAVAVSEKLKDTDITSGSKSATFTVTLDDPDKTQNVTYIYPAAMAKADGSVNYDALASQNGTLSTLASQLDLATKSDAWNGDNLPSLTLVNQLAILVCTLKNEAGSSEITSTITGMTVSDGTNSYAVTRAAAAGPIYVAIRPTSSATIDITATDGEYNYTKSLTGKTYALNNGYSVSWRMTKGASPIGTINGKFTINSSNDQVYFSKGNLQAKTTDLGANWTWSFAEHQWEYVGEASGNRNINGNGTVYTNGTVDLFSWVGASSTLTGGAQYGIIISADGYGTSATENLKSDWGNTIGTGWRTLTSAEWSYLFQSRTNANNLRTFATVNGKTGLIIMPDGWTASGVSLTPTVANYTTNDISTEDWTTLESQGCVFLPAAGIRSITTITYVGSRGYYWSSSSDASNVNYAYRLCFSSGGSNILDPLSHESRKFGSSVRLVRAAN